MKRISGTMLALVILLCTVCTDGLAGSCYKCRYGECFSTLAGYGFCENCVVADECGIAACFLAGTEVETPHGTRPIEELRVGDWVTTRSADGPSYGMVVNTYRATAYSYLKINGSIQVTETHPFSVNGDWVQAGDLRVGDRLRTLDGHIEILTIERVDRGVRVYNIEVDGLHTFTAEGLLVHNKGPDPQG